MQQIIFQPEVPIWIIAILAVLTLAMVILALWRGLPGWWLRALAGLVLLTAIANPALKDEEREPLSNIALVVYDETSSQSLDLRPDQLADAITSLEAELGSNSQLEVVEVRVGDGEGDDAGRGTLLATAVATAVAEQAQDRLAGIFIVSDGRIDDMEMFPDPPAPVHLLLTGRADEWDRRLVVETAPAFGIIGESVTVSVRVEAIGEPPGGNPPAMPLSVSIDGEEPELLRVPFGETVPVEIDLTHGGMNLVQMILPPQEGELTDRNNSAIVEINGVRDRLRVLLVSGEPHAGERTWRNLLKSDPAVDLVHFTILRPPHKQDGVPVYELSLIAFPTRELFMDKIDEFDLIIFDRYRRRGVLPSLYLENLARYVRDGGALLVASGASFAGAESLYRTPLAEILPVAPTAQVIEEGFVPMISEIGQRHPVTEGLEEFAPRETVEGIPGWGRWFRLIDTVPVNGHVVMEGPDNRPLLVMDRPGEGRIAALASDHAWLWSRGYEGGGPQLELLRRLAHWLMQEPELEEEVLTATANDGSVTVSRRTMAEEVGELEVTEPGGESRTLTLEQTSPGRFEAVFEAGDNGVYRLVEGDKRTVVAVGESAPKEFENPLSTAEVLGPTVEASRGGVFRLEDGFPELRAVREGRLAAGRGWMGLAERDAYNVVDIKLTPLAPGWLMLLFAAGLAVLAWRIEGR